jgi:hypothetical protein
MESYAGRIIAVNLLSDPFDTTYGMLWVGDSGFLISDMDSIACDGYDLAIQEFNRRTYVSAIQYSNINNMMVVSSQVDQQVIDDINKVVPSFEGTMHKLSFIGPPKKQTKDMSKYPHKCPICGQAAYIGFSVADIECSNSSCSYYR